jgi:hypothetical protein
MKLRSLFKITFLCLLPSIALLFIARSYWRPLAERFLASTEALAAIRDSEVPRRLAWTGIWIALALYLLAAVNHFLSPELARRRQTKELPALLRDLIRYGLFVRGGDRPDDLRDVAPLGALGIGGVVLGLALRETLSTPSRAALLAEQPFSQATGSDRDRVEGVVEHITG